MNSLPIVVGSFGTKEVCVSRAVLPLAFLLVLTAGPVAGENWPQWRGPNLNGVSGEKNVPLKWSATENVTWKLPVPNVSGSTPVIWGDHVFLSIATGPAETDSLEIWSVNRADGSVRWKAPMGRGNQKVRKGDMTSPSPVTDGKTVWLLTGTGVVKAFDFQGKELWARDLQKDYGKFGLNHGYGSSPLLYQGALFIPVLHGMNTDDPSYLVKLDAKSGKPLWKVDRPTEAIRESPDAYITPALLKYGKTTEIVLSGGDVVTGHDPDSGKELWRVNGLNPENNPFYRIIASPVAGNGIIYAPTRVKPMLAIKTGGRGDITKTHVAWSFDRGPDVPTPVFDSKFLYVVDDRGVVHCLDAQTGAVVYGPERLRPGTYSSSPVLADGRIYVSNEDGYTVVFAQGPKFEVLAENTVDEYMLGSVAISEGQVFLRTGKHVFCIGKRAPGGRTSSSQ
jgi:outer membrane protein assembly factor BamB